MFLSLLKKFFLTKEIMSKEGVVHFRRYRLISTPWFNIYVHQILKSDEDKHFHDHPWHFASLLLKGAYRERSSYSPRWSSVITFDYYAGQIVRHLAHDAHSLTLLTSSVWTLVFTFGKKRVWGYQTDNGWIDFKTYRQLKNEGKV